MTAKKRRARPRPTKTGKGRGKASAIAPELVRRLSALISEGHYVETACGLAGLAPSTFYAWLQRAEKEEPEFVDFRDAMEKARAIAEDRALHVVQEAARPYTTERVETKTEADGKVTHTVVRTVNMPDWKAAAWLLERKHPERWGRRQVLQHTGTLHVKRVILSPPAGGK